MSNPRFVLRVDDIGQAPLQFQPDKELKYFRRWWDAGGWGDLPVYLGVVPAVLGELERNMLLQLEDTTGAEICLHGWDHGDRMLSRNDIHLATKAFPAARCVIPPYNKSDEATVAAMEEFGLRVLFGGFHGEHYQLGLEIGMIGKVLFLPASRDLYDRSYVVANLVDVWGATSGGPWEGSNVPLVITLHHRWDTNFLEGVRRLRDLVAPHLITVDEVLREYAN